MTLNLRISNNDVACVICKQSVSIDNTTAGALYADGTQAFACNDHALIKPTWLVAWARFAIEQRRLKEQQPAVSLRRIVGV